MGKERIHNIIIFILLSILTGSVVYRFVPHHHHDGKICVETNETDTDFPAHEENFHSEISVYDIPKTDSKSIACFVDWSPGELIVNKISNYIHSYSRCETLFRCIHDTREGYGVRTHKLRGSPFKQP